MQGKDYKAEFGVIHGSPIPAFVIGRDHKVIFWNQALEKLSKIPASEVVGTKDQWRAFYSSERPCMADLLVDEAISQIPEWYSGKYNQSALVGGAFEATDFFPTLGEKGKWLRFTAALMRDAEGEITGAIETLEDVTEKQHAEQALKESEQRLFNIIQGSPIPTFVIGKDHRVLYWNRALEELSRIPASEMIGTVKHWKAFYGEERPCMADLLIDKKHDKIPQWYSGKYTRSSLIEEAYEATDFFPALGENGKWLRFTAAVIRDSMGELVGAVETLEDITERSEAQEALQKAKDELEDKVRERTVQLTEMNNSLLAEVEERKHTEKRLRSAQKNLRAMSAEIVIADERSRHHFATDLHDTVVQTLGAAKMRSEFLREYIPSEVSQHFTALQDLLSQSIIESRSIMSEMSPPILHQLGLIPALEWLSEQIGTRHRLTVKFEASDGFEPLKYEIQVLLFQATRELLMNIVKHANAREVLVTVQGDKQKVRIIIFDDGKGFDGKISFRTDKSGGFGLFSIRERLRYIGGHLSIHSKPGQGTRITMVAPRIVE